MSITKRVFFLIVGCSVFLTACTSTSTAARSEASVSSSGSVASAPEWITQPSLVYPNAKYFAYVGTGADRVSAELQAIQGIISIFGQSISTTTTATQRLKSAQEKGTVASSTNATLDQEVVKKVNQDDVIAIDIKESFHDEKRGTWYVLALMDRAKASSLYSAMISKNDTQIAYLREAVSSSKDVYTMQNYARLDFAREIAVITDTYIERLRIINSSEAAKFSNDALTAVAIKRAQQDIAKKIPICIKVTNDTDGRIAKTFASTLSEYGFTSTGGSKERYVVNCDMQLASTTSANGKTHFCEYTVSGTLTDTSIGEDLVPFTFSGRDGSTTAQNAESRARTKIASLIQTNFTKALDAYLQSK
ncbi:MAG: LPP20 family lipoprotein [Treponema sp.]|nr:LPP20 family lipoprotein [Treponema sp.]